MNEIEKVAAKYFERFESLALYPGPKTRDFWLAAGGVAIFIGGLLWYFKYGSRIGHDSPGAVLVILAADGGLIGASALVSRFHKARALDLANLGRGSNLQTLEAAKAATLCRFLNCRSFEFLRVASEIQQLRAFAETSGAPWRSETAWLQGVWFDDGTKSRLMSIFLSVLAVLVTLLATSAAVQDQFFSAISDAGVWQLIAFLEFFALFLVSVLWGALRMLRTVSAVAVRWSLKVSHSRWATGRKVDYLVHDLARLHRMRPRRAEGSTSP